MVSVRIRREVATHPPRERRVTERIYILIPVAFFEATFTDQVFDLFGIVKRNVLLVEFFGGIFLLTP